MAAVYVSPPNWSGAPAPAARSALPLIGHSRISREVVSGAMLGDGLFGLSAPRSNELECHDGEP